MFTKLGVFQRPLTIFSFPEGEAEIVQFLRYYSPHNPEELKCGKSRDSESGHKSMGKSRGHGGKVGEKAGVKVQNFLFYPYFHPYFYSHCDPYFYPCFLSGSRTLLLPHFNSSGLWGGGGCSSARTAQSWTRRMKGRTRKRRRRQGGPRARRCCHCCPKVVTPLPPTDPLPTHSQTHIQDLVNPNSLPDTLGSHFFAATGHSGRFLCNFDPPRESFEDVFDLAGYFCFARLF